MGPDVHSITVTNAPLSSSTLVCQPCRFHLSILINLVILKIAICTSSTCLVHCPLTILSPFSLYNYCQPASPLFHLFYLASFELWELGTHRTCILVVEDERYKISKYAIYDFITILSAHLLSTCSSIISSLLSAWDLHFLSSFQCFTDILPILMSMCYRVGKMVPLGQEIFILYVFIH